MRLALSVLFGTLHLVGVGQTAPEFLQVPPDWKKGQRVSFDTHMSVGMTMNDSVPFRTETSARGVLEVTDLVSDGFVVTFQSVGDMPVDMTMDLGFTDEGARALLDSSMRMVMAFAEPFKEIQVTYLISRDGEVLDILDQDRLMRDIGTAMEKGLPKLIPDSLIDRLPGPVIDSLMQSQLDAIVQVQVNHLNVLLMGHLLGFPTSGKYREDAMIDAVDAPLFEDAEPVKGWLEVMLVEETDQTLTGQLETIYDPEGLHEELVKRHPDLDPTRWEGLEMREVRTFHFDLESGWIDRVNEVITFSLPGIEGRSTTVTTLQLQ